jgi:hypothetical protein
MMSEIKVNNTLSQMFYRKRIEEKVPEKEIQSKSKSRK